MQTHFFGYVNRSSSKGPLRNPGVSFKRNWWCPPFETCLEQSPGDCTDSNKTWNWRRWWWWWGPRALECSPAHRYNPGADEFAAPLCDTARAFHPPQSQSHSLSTLCAPLMRLVNQESRLYCNLHTNLHYAHMNFFNQQIYDIWMFLLKLNRLYCTRGAVRLR